MCGAMIRSTVAVFVKRSEWYPSKLSRTIINGHLWTTSYGDNGLEQLIFVVSFAGFERYAYYVLLLYCLDVHETAIGTYEPSLVVLSGENNPFYQLLVA